MPLRFNLFKISISSIGWNQFVVQAVPETLRQTTLGQLAIKQTVNLERNSFYKRRTSCILWPDSQHAEALASFDQLSFRKA